MTQNVTGKGALCYNVIVQAVVLRASPIYDATPTQLKYLSLISSNLFEMIIPSLSTYESCGNSNPDGSSFCNR